MVAVGEPEHHRKDLEQIERVQDLIDQQQGYAFDRHLNVAGSVQLERHVVSRGVANAATVQLIDLLARNLTIENDWFKLSANELVLNEPINEDLHLE